MFNSEPESILSVAELTGQLKELVEHNLDEVWVLGELSNFRKYRSGHAYFTLKDEDAEIRGVMWRTYIRNLFFEPEDGMLVRVRGKASIYPKRGELQLVASSMQPSGQGSLQQAFEELKRRMAREGLFDAELKKRLPSYPESIGIITSGDGAALHDILSILKRRFPQVRVLVCPVLVQGFGASSQISEAIEAFNSLPEGDEFRPDVLIVGRGGGSTEDLWAFNEEKVARAIFSSQIPVVSAVGHETDFSISDFVADVRAATPSMAAELVVPNRRDVELLIQGYCEVLKDFTEGQIRESRQHILALIRSYAFHQPVALVEQYQQRLDQLEDRLIKNVALRLNSHSQHLRYLSDRLTLLDPRRPLTQGYVRVQRDGKAVNHASKLIVGEKVNLEFIDGSRTARVEE